MGPNDGQPLTEELRAYANHPRDVYLEIASAMELRGQRDRQTYPNGAIGKIFRMERAANNSSEALVEQNILYVRSIIPSLTFDETGETLPLTVNVQGQIFFPDKILCTTILSAEIDYKHNHRLELDDIHSRQGVHIIIVVLHE